MSRVILCVLKEETLWESYHESSALRSSHHLGHPGKHQWVRDLAISLLNPDRRSSLPWHHQNRWRDLLLIEHPSER